VKRRKRGARSIGGALVVLALAVILAGCGSSDSPSEAASTIYPESSPTGTGPALKAYLSDAQDVLGQVSTTVETLPDAVQGMNKRPDDTWTSASAQLQSIATQLGDEAGALAALQPPSALQPVQDAAVKGIQAAQTGIEKLATQLASKPESLSNKRSEVQAKVDELKAQVDGLSTQLQNALSTLTGQ
jgi:peptidoglycan hydrolase CwlO-like protein